MVTCTESEVITLQTSRGSIKVEKKNLIHFTQGLYGFDGYTDFAFFDIKGCKPFRSMLSIQEGGPDFVVVEPLLIFDDYKPLESFKSLSQIGIGDPVELVVLSIVTLAENPADITINLRGPIFLNLATRQAKQVILPDDKYLTKTPIVIGKENQAE